MSVPAAASYSFATNWSRPLMRVARLGPFIANRVPVTQMMTNRAHDAVTVAFRHRPNSPHRRRRSARRASHHVSDPTSAKTANGMIPYAQR